MLWLHMKQTARIISTYSADVFGVCSALFELGGMIIMHDASGCNSTYTTHDEPRWYDMESMVYISGLAEMEAIMGDDEKLIGDIVAAAESLHPRFIAVAGTPIPAMTGFDYAAVAAVLEDRTGIPAFGFPTTGMHTYVRGVSMALEAVAKRFVDGDAVRTDVPSVNILGLTPLDFSVNGADAAIVRFAENAGYRVISRWAMGSSPEEIARAGCAWVNLVVSSAGLAAAEVLRKRFGTPYVVGVPMGEYAPVLRDALHEAVKTGENAFPRIGEGDGDILIIGEAVGAVSLASAMEMSVGCGTKVLCPTEDGEVCLRMGDELMEGEEDAVGAMASARLVIADPLFRPVCPEGVPFAELPAEAFSGRIFRHRIPNLVEDADTWIKEVI